MTIITITNAPTVVDQQSKEPNNMIDHVDRMAARMGAEWAKREPTMTEKPTPDVVAPFAWHFEQQFPPYEDFVPCLAKQEPDADSIHIRNVMPLYSKAAIQARPDARTHDDTLEDAALAKDKVAAMRQDLKG